MLELCYIITYISKYANICKVLSTVPVIFYLLDILFYLGKFVESADPGTGLP